MAADAVSKELGLNQPSEQHGATATDHVQEKLPSTSNADAARGLDHDVEKGWEAIRTTSRPSPAPGLARTQSGVDVEQAERDFAELSKQFSAHSRRMSRTQSRARVPSIAAKDVEKAVSSEATSQEAWDLEETLRGAKEADYEAGIKSKYIGKNKCAGCVRVDSRES